MDARLICLLYCFFTAAYLCCTAALLQVEARLIFAPVTEMTEDFLREVSLSDLVLLYFTASLASSISSSAKSLSQPAEKVKPQ